MEKIFLIGELFLLIPILFANENVNVCTSSQKIIPLENNGTSKSISTNWNETAFGLVQLVTTYYHASPWYSTATVGLFCLGSIGAFFYQILSWVIYFVRREGVLILEVSCKEECYSWMLQWIKRYAGRSARHVSVEAEDENGNEDDESFWTADPNYRVMRHESEPKFKLIPAAGTHFVKYREKWLRIDRVKDDKEENRRGGRGEMIYLTTYGRDVNYFLHVLDECKKIGHKERTIGVPVFRARYGDCWEAFGRPRRKRPLDSIVLEKGVIEMLFDDIQEFLADEDWFLRRGIPYRRGYLLYGPPGCGKSSTILALASELNFGVCVLSLRSTGDDELWQLFGNIPRRTFVLLEDVDAAFKTRETSTSNKNESTKKKNQSAEKNSEDSGKISEDEKNEENQDQNTENQPNVDQPTTPRCTLSGLLNALDGIVTTEGRILFMTTNYAEKLDPALIRPGRADIKVYVGYCNEYQIKKLFMRFYDNVEESLADTFAKRVAAMNLELTAAVLQSYLQIYRRSVQNAIANVEALQIMSAKILEHDPVHLSAVGN